MEISNKRSISLRTVLIILFIIEIFASVFITGILSFNSGKKAVQNTTNKLRNEISSHINDTLQNYIKIPHIVNAINSKDIKNKYLNINDFKSLEKHFLNQIQIFDTISYISYGSINGDFIGIERKIDNNLYLEIRSKETQNAKHTYTLDEKGNIKKLISISENYDASKRPWFLTAKIQGKQSWSDIYPFFTPPHRLGITAVQPVYDNNGKLMGVLGSDLVLDHLNVFLKKLNTGYNSEIIIVDQSGLLVGTSSKDQLVLKNENGLERIKVTSLNKPYLNKVLKDVDKSLDKIDNVRKNFNIPNFVKYHRDFIKTIPIKDNYGLNWTAVVIVPESEFMEIIEISKHEILSFSLIAILIATLIGIFVTSRITRPLYKISNDMELVSDFKLNPNNDNISKFTEVRSIQSSLIKMNSNLKEYTHVLNSLNIITDKVIKVKDKKELFQIILNYAIDLTKSEKGIVLEYMPDENNFEVIHFLNTNIDSSKTYIVSDNKYLSEVSNKIKPLIIENSDEILGEKFETAILAPLLFEKELKGIIILFNRNENAKSKVFTKYELRTLNGLCKLASSIWQNIHLFELATIDNLSKLYVRRYFDKAFNEEIKRSLRYKNSLGVILIDIDNFKRCNDTYGHLIGDKIIREVANKIKECVRETDFPGRYGGEEFIIFMPQTAEEGALKLAERIRKSVEDLEIFVYSKKALNVTVSIGVSCLPANATTASDLIFKADEALYKSKRSGKNKVTLANNNEIILHD